MTMKNPKSLKLDIVLRVERSSHYKTIGTYGVEIDDRLSWKAVGILVYLISRPDRWKFFVSDLEARHMDGKTSVSAGVKELEDAGYLIRRTIRLGGCFHSKKWYVSEKPLSPEEWEQIIQREESQ